MIASSYPFADAMWTMLVFFLWIMWFYLLFVVYGDVFRRHDIGGLGKTGWIIFTFVLPFLGVFVYLIAEGKGMAERSQQQVQAQKAQFDEYVKQAAGSDGAATQIEKAKGLLDSGAITQPEYDAIKQKALAAA